MILGYAQRNRSVGSHSLTDFPACRVINGDIRRCGLCATLAPYIPPAIQSMPRIPHPENCVVKISTWNKIPSEFLLAGRWHAHDRGMDNYEALPSGPPGIIRLRTFNGLIISG